MIKSKGALKAYLKKHFSVYRKDGIIRFEVNVNEQMAYLICPEQPENNVQVIMESFNSLCGEKVIKVRKIKHGIIYCDIVIW